MDDKKRFSRTVISRALLKEGKISNVEIDADRISGTADLRGGAAQQVAKAR